MYRAPFIFGGVILLLIIGAILLFGGGGKKPSNTNPIKPLPSYANTDATVSMTIDGPVNGDDAHRAIRITVGQNERDLDIIQGYSGTVISHQQFYNTQDAYSVFLKSINNSGFLLQRKGTPANLDDSGQCALGERFIFQLQENGKTLSDLWTSSCGSTTGNLEGQEEVLESLFQNQITNYDTLTENVDFSE